MKRTEKYSAEFWLNLFKDYDETFWAELAEDLQKRKQGKYTSPIPIAIRAYIRSIGGKSKLLESRKLFEHLIDFCREYLYTLNRNDKQEISQVKENILACEFALKEINDALSNYGRNRKFPHRDAVKAKADELGITKYTPANANKIQHVIKPEMTLRTVADHLKWWFPEP